MLFFIDMYFFFSLSLLHFSISFKLKNYLNQVVAEAITPAIFVTDDHKPSKKSLKIEDPNSNPTPISVDNEEKETDEHSPKFMDIVKSKDIGSSEKQSQKHSIENLSAFSPPSNHFFGSPLHPNSNGTSTSTSISTSISTSSSPSSSTSTSSTSLPPASNLNPIQHTIRHSLPSGNLPFYSSTSFQNWTPSHQEPHHHPSFNHPNHSRELNIFPSIESSLFPQQPSSFFFFFFFFFNSMRMRMRKLIKLKFLFSIIKILEPKVMKVLPTEGKFYPTFFSFFLSLNNFFSFLS